VLVDPVDFVVCDACQGDGKPHVRIDTIELGGLDQRVGDCRGSAARLRSDEEVVLAAQSGGSHRAFGGIGVDLRNVVIEVSEMA
jgi:hypothetical protein